MAAANPHPRHPRRRTRREYATSTKTELADLTSADRALAGPVHVFNPTGLGGVASTLRWDPVAGDSDQRPVPLLTAFTEAVFATAKQVAAARPAGHLDPPLGLFVDEIADITPVPPTTGPRTRAAGGSRSGRWSRTSHSWRPGGAPSGRRRSRPRGVRRS
ncbi:hypothetical protein GCM10023175_38400 [Pseudonocardia xishanensis]|uniref:Type IV secretory system conjugative DNA transfer VirD4/TraG family protein n=1 Tax=Pseudonocardia xishanensis TaxID=630995 RepID=A0ABP8RUH5_9PSEU